MKSYLRLSCGILLAAATSSAAQELSPLRLEPSSGYYHRGVIESADFDTIDGRTVRARWDHIVARFGNREWRGFQVGLGFAWEFTRPDYGGIVSRNRDLHRVQVPITFEKRYADWALSGYLAPTIATSSNVLRQFPSEGSSSDLTMSARILATWPGDSPELSWQLGLINDRRFGSTKLYPTGGFIYESGPWHLEFLLPQPRAGLQIGERQRLEGRIYPAGQSWHVKNKFTGGEYTYFLEGWRAEFGWHWKAHRRFGLGLSVGYEFDRRHEYVDDESIPQRSDVENSPFIALTLTGSWSKQ